jgi:chromosome partitioning protein
MKESRGSTLMKMEPVVIALMNNKGGVGKTTLGFNQAKHYLRNGRKVIAVDFDQQEQMHGLLPEITRSDVKADELKELECEYVIVDTGPTFHMDHLELMDEVDLILIPLQLEMLDIQQSVKLLKTIKRSNHQRKARILVTHSGERTLMYKTLMPALQAYSKEFGIEIIAEMRKSQAVAQANLEKKTVFEINSPPEVRSQFKALHKAIGKALSEVRPSAAKLKDSSLGGESCQAH